MFGTKCPRKSIVGHVLVIIVKGQKFKPIFGHHYKSLRHPKEGFSMYTLIWLSYFRKLKVINTYSLSWTGSPGGQKSYP